MIIEIGKYSIESEKAFSCDIVVVVAPRITYIFQKYFISLIKEKSKVF